MPFSTGCVRRTSDRDGGPGRGAPCGRNADLADPEIRAAFEVGAPAVVQRLSELGEGKADYVTHREVTVEGRDEGHSLSVSMNEQGRAAVGVLEHIAGGVLDEVLTGADRESVRTGRTSHR
jgi:hypothetical protein